jgi:hypothetical protein
MAEKRLDILVSAKDNGATSFFDRLASKAKQVQRDDRMSGESALGRFARGGAGGAADFGLSMLGAGGAAIGIQFAGTALKNVATSLQEIRDLSKDVSKDWTDIADKLGRSVPVFGEVFAAGREIRELFTGTRAEIEKINAETKAMTAHQDAVTTQAKLQKDAYAEMSKIITDLQRKLQIGGAGGGVAAQLLQLGFTEQDTAESVNKTVDAKIKTLRDATPKATAPIESQLVEAQKTAAFQNEGHEYARKHLSTRTEMIRKALADNANAEVAVLEKKIADRKKIEADAVAKLEIDRQKALSLVAKNGEQDRTRLLDAAENQRNEIRRNAYDAARDEEDKARQERLKAEGKALEAELDMIETSARNRREAIAKSALEGMQQTLDAGGGMLDVMALAGAAGRQVAAVNGQTSLARSAAIANEQSAMFDALGQAMFDAVSGRGGGGGVTFNNRTAALQSERFATGDGDLIATRTYEIQKKTADNTKVTAEAAKKTAELMNKFVNDSITGQIFAWGGVSNN